MRYFAGYKPFADILSDWIFFLSAIGTAIAIAAKVVTWVGFPHLTSDIFLVAAVVVGLILFPMVALLVLRYSWFVAPVFALSSVATVLVAAPRMAALHDIGRGTDQGDCIIVAADRMSNGLWPYSAAAMRTHNAMSCGPLWAGFHLPLLEVSTYSIAMLILVAISILIVVIAAGPASAAKFGTLLALIPGYWLALANGNDFATFGVALAALIALATSAYANRWFVLIFLLIGVVALSQARLPFLALPAIVFMDTKKHAGWLGPAAQIVALTVWLAFLLFGTESFTTEGPMHVISKAHAQISPEVFMGILAAGTFGLFAVARIISIPDAFIRTEVYVGTVLIGMSVLDLAAKIGTRHSLAEALTYWEGASWLTGAACLAAIDLATRGNRRRRTLATTQEQMH